MVFVWGCVFLVDQHVCIILYSVTMVCHYLMMSRYYFSYRRTLCVCVHLFPASMCKCVSACMCLWVFTWSTMLLWLCCVALDSHVAVFLLFVCTSSWSSCMYVMENMFIFLQFKSLLIATASPLLSSHPPSAEYQSGLDRECVAARSTAVSQLWSCSAYSALSTSRKNTLVHTNTITQYIITV